jgi:hypothetical protein
VTHTLAYYNTELITTVKNDTTTILIITLHIMKILKTLDTGGIIYNDITY